MNRTRDIQYTLCVFEENAMANAIIKYTKKNLHKYNNLHTHLMLYVLYFYKHKYNHTHASNVITQAQQFIDNMAVLCYCVGVIRV